MIDVHINLNNLFRKFKLNPKNTVEYTARHLPPYKTKDTCLILTDRNHQDDLKGTFEDFKMTAYRLVNNERSAMVVKIINTKTGSDLVLVVNQKQENINYSVCTAQAFSLCMSSEEILEMVDYLQLRKLNLSNLDLDLSIKLSELKNDRTFISPEVRHDINDIHKLFDNSKHVVNGWLRSLPVRVLSTYKTKEKSLIIQMSDEHGFVIGYLITQTTSKDPNKIGNYRILNNVNCQSACKRVVRPYVLRLSSKFDQQPSLI